MRRINQKRSHSRAFTIIELIVAIVIIGILAGLVTISYNTITSKTKQKNLENTLVDTAAKIKEYASKNNKMPANLAAVGVSNPDGIVLTYDDRGYSNFCLSAKKDSKSFFINSDTANLEDGDCSQPIQSITRAQCDAFPVYDGANLSALKTVTDDRGGAIKNYEIAKLADNNCWMLTNLKLGSTSQSIALTPQNTNIITNFTLPQVQAIGSSSLDDPTVGGPVRGDTGVGQANYGYLYNWPAATAGETRTSHPAAEGVAPYSICPKNWRLPTGDRTGDFAMLNARMNDPSATSPSTSSGTGYYQNWQYTGPFKGVHSGTWSSGSFYNQSSWSGTWSASSMSSGGAYDAEIYPTYAYMGFVGRNRSEGLAVRCVL